MICASSNQLFFMSVSSVDGLLLKSRDQKGGRSWVDLDSAHVNRQTATALGSQSPAWPVLHLEHPNPRACSL